MASTKFIALAALFAVTNAGLLGGPGYTVPDYSRRGTPAILRTTPVYGDLMTSISPSSMPSMSGNDGDSTARMNDRTFTTTEMPATNSRYEDNTDHDDNPSYSYAYDVKDSETGDTKAHSESLENGVVKGIYSVVDPNGVRRTVHYTADAVSGFNAVVNMEPTNVVIPTPRANARQFNVETSTEKQLSTTSGPTTTVAETMADATSGPQSQPAVYTGPPLVYRPAPVVYRAPAPRIFYTPVVHHQVPHQVQRIAISTTPVAFAVDPVHKAAIYG